MKSKAKSFPQVFCINGLKKAKNGTKIQVFRIIHRVFHSFTHIKKAFVENFFARFSPTHLTNANFCGIINKKRKAQSAKP